MNLLPLFVAFVSMACWVWIARARMGRLRDTGGWVQFIPAAISLASGLLNKKKAPATAPYEEVNLADEQDKAIDANLAQQPDIEKLLGQANRFTQTQANELMEQAAPGYSAFSKRIMDAGNEALDNQYDLPPEVIENLTRISAERGISRGTRGQFNQYSGLRDLGVNMLDYGNSQFNRALQALTTVTGIAPRVSPISPLSFYVTPAMSVQNQTNNNTQQQGINQGGANAGAGASNWNSANLWDSIAQAAGSIFGGAGGGIGGGTSSAKVQTGGMTRVG